MLTFYQNLKPQIAKKYRNKLMLQWWAVKQLLKGKLRLRNTFGDEIRVKDEITCWQGDKLQFRTKGHIVSYGLMLMVNYLSFAGTSSATAAYGMMYSVVYSMWNRNRRYCTINNWVGDDELYSAKHLSLEQTVTQAPDNTASLGQLHGIQVLFQQSPLQNLECGGITVSLAAYYRTKFTEFWF